MLTDKTMLEYTAAALALANLWVSFSVIRSPFYSAGQKVTQCLIVWFIPLFGAVGIWVFLHSQYNWQKYNTRAFPERREKMIAVEIDNAIHDSFGDGGHASGD